jgi:hypothetical protein
VLRCRQRTKLPTSPNLLGTCSETNVAEANRQSLKQPRRMIDRLLGGPPVNFAVTADDRSVKLGAACRNCPRNRRCGSEPPPCDRCNRAHRSPVSDQSVSMTSSLLRHVSRVSRPGSSHFQPTHRNKLLLSQLRNLQETIVRSFITGHFLDANNGRFTSCAATAYRLSRSRWPFYATRSDCVASASLRSNRDVSLFSSRHAVCTQRIKQAEVNLHDYAAAKKLGLDAVDV